MGKRALVNGLLALAVGVAFLLFSQNLLEVKTTHLVAGLGLVLFGVHEMAHRKQLCKCERR